MIYILAYPLFGGPDGFGYVFLSNQDGDTIPFSYIDITATGVFIDAGDDWCSGADSSTLFYLGFSFPFYGRLVDSVSVCSNGGVITEGTHAFLSYINDSLPYDGGYTGGFGAILAMWDDLDPSALSTSGIYFQSFSSCPDGYYGSCAVVQYHDVPRRGVSSVPMDFEIILYDNGNIKLQYNSRIYYNDATVGIQDSTAVVGVNPDWYLQYVYNGTPSGHVPDSGTAVLFVYPTGTSITEIPHRGQRFRVIGRTLITQEDAILYDVSGRVLAHFNGTFYIGRAGVFFIKVGGKTHRLVIR